MSIAIILIVLALVLFGLAAFLWQPPAEPYRFRLVAAGLFFWVLYILVQAGLKL